MKSNKFIVELESPFDVPTTVEKIIEAAKQRNWQNPANHDMQQSLAKSGKHVKPVQIVEICKSDFSGMMLERNHERIFSVMMPCRISVYEKDDHKTYIALLDTTSLAEGMPEAVVTAMTDASNGSFEIVESVIHS